VFIFWVTFFANQRGCSVEFRAALLPQLISTTKGEVLEWCTAHFNECKTVFNNIHDKILADFATELDTIASFWIKSPAGKFFHNLVAEARYDLK